MKALLQRQWRCCSLSFSHRPPLSELQDIQSPSFHGTSFNVEECSQLSTRELSTARPPLDRSFFPELLAPDQRNLSSFHVQKSLAHPVLSSLSTGKTSDFTSSLVQETRGHPCAITFFEFTPAKTANLAQRSQDGFRLHGKNVRALHMAAAKLADMAALERAGSSLDAENSEGEDGGELDTDEELEVETETNVAVYEELKEYVQKKHGNKPEFSKMVEAYNPMAEMKEPTIEDFRPPDRELPPFDRVTIALDIDEQYRVTRKTKWVTKQLRSPVMNDVPALLEQWVKTMYPKRSDWLDLLKEFDKHETEQNLMFQIYEFALLEDTFEVTSQDLARIIVKYMNVERYDDVDRLMGTLDAKGFPPDFVVSTLLLDMNCKLKRLDQAREMFDRMRSLDYLPDVTACTKLIEFYSESGNPEAGEMILSEMEEEKLHGTVDTYLAVLKGYGKQGRASDADRIFSIMTQDIFLKPHIGPDVYSALMNAYVQANRLPSAVVLMEDMLLSNLVPADESVSMLIAAYEKKNHFEKALNVLLKLESKAIRPGVDTLATLIGWFGKLGLVEEAETLFKNIEAKVDVPDGKAYASLFSTYARTGSMDKARAILDCVEKKKVVMNSSNYEQMILSLLDGGQREEAQSLRDQMISQGLTPSDEVERALLGIQAESRTSKPLVGEAQSLGAETESIISGMTKRLEGEAQSSGAETESFIAGMNKRLEGEAQSSGAETLDGEAQSSGAETESFTAGMDKRLEEAPESL